MKMTLREETLVKFDSFIFQMTLRMYTDYIKGENIQIVKRENQRFAPVTSSCVYYKKTYRDNIPFS